MLHEVDSIGTQVGCSRMLLSNCVIMNVEKHEQQKITFRSLRGRALTRDELLNLKNMFLGSLIKSTKPVSAAES